MASASYIPRLTCVQDPLALMGIGAIMFPFFFLLIAIAFGLVDLNGGR